MRKLTVLLIALLLVGCASEGGGESVSLFGRINSLITLGSTEEKIAHKLLAEEYMLTVAGEVLMDKPGRIEAKIIDRNTSDVANNLDAVITICSVPVSPEGFYTQAESCANDPKAVSLVSKTATFEDGAYSIEGFEWPIYNAYLVEIELTDRATGSTTEPISIDLDTYEQRPRSTTSFELINLSLPFIAIGLFIAGTRAFNGSFVSPIDKNEVPA